MRKPVAVLLIGTALAVLSATALAHGRVSFGIAIGVPGPVYVAPPPVYYPVSPVYYYAPPLYYGPPVYYTQAPWRHGVRINGRHHRGWRGHH